jgi:hypothetical protein
VLVFLGGQVSSTGTGAITITGRGGQGTFANSGIQVGGAGSLVNSVTAPSSSPAPAGRERASSTTGS